MKNKIYHFENLKSYSFEIDEKPKTEFSKTVSLSFTFYSIMFLIIAIIFKLQYAPEMCFIFAVGVLFAEIRIAVINYLFEKRIVTRVLDIFEEIWSTPQSRRDVKLLLRLFEDQLTCDDKSYKYSYKLYEQKVVLLTLLIVTHTEDEENI